MSEPLIKFYDEELRYLHLLTQEFRQQFPAAADRLRLEPSGGSSDANLERLLQSYALLAGRTRAKLDDDYPELSRPLLQLLYPHFLAPIPSMCIAQFDPDPVNAQMPQGCPIERGSAVNTTTAKPVACQFRTAYPTTLWPVRVVEARYQPPPFPAGLTIPPGAAAALRIKLQCLGQLTWSQLQLERLRFFLHGDFQLTTDLYEALFRHAIQVMIRPATSSSKQEPLIFAPENCLFPVGFDESESLLPYGPHARLGYRLVTELFTFPAKFQFVDLGGWRDVARGKFDNTCEVILFFNATSRRLEQGISADQFRLGCAPLVNLFEKAAEPIPVRPLRHEYRIAPTATHPQAFEVYGVERVESVDPASHKKTEYAPFHALEHERDGDTIFWHADRRGSLEKDDAGTELFLALRNLSFEPRWPADEVLQVQTMCTNRDLPARLHAEGSFGALRLQVPKPVREIRCLVPPTPTLRPPTRRGGWWRLISHLSPNYLSMQHASQALPALREMLQLYDFSDPLAGQQHLAAQTRQMIDGILGVESRRVLGRVPGSTFPGFCRGMEVTVRLDPEKFPHTGALLFAAVLERFFALYASANSFTQLVAKTSETLIKKWPPRAGATPLL